MARKVDIITKQNGDVVLEFRDNSQSLELGIVDGNLAATKGGTDVLVDNLQYRFFTDGTTKYRQGCREGKFVLDKALTLLGFSGYENTDWENINEIE